MVHIEGEIIIDRPVQEVFDFVADERNEPPIREAEQAPRRIRRNDERAFASGPFASECAPSLQRPASDEQHASGNELQPRALPAQCDRQRGGGADVARGGGANRLGHEAPFVS